MRQREARGILAVLGCAALVTGGWALLAPRSFYDDFPGGGEHWVAPDGPFNEHLVRDVGGLYLAVLAVTVSALMRTTTELCRVTAVVWLVFGVPHAWYHAHHLDVLEGGSAAANMVVLLVGLVLPVALLFRGKDEPPRADDVSGGPARGGSSDRTTAAPHRLLRVGRSDARETRGRVLPARRSQRE